MDLPKKDFDALITKIQKINALASSPNENEANVASRMVHDLLLQYNLDMSSLSYTDDDTMKEVTYQLKSIDPLWRITLIQTMASFYFCQCYILNYSTGLFKKGTKEIGIVGKPCNIIVAKEMIKYIFDSIERMSLQCEGTSKFKQNYREGIASRIIDKIKEIMKEETSSGSSTKDIIVREDHNLNIFLKKKYGDPSKVEMEAETEMQKGFNKGYEDGKILSLNVQLKHNTKKKMEIA